MARPNKRQRLARAKRQREAEAALIERRQVAAMQAKQLKPLRGLRSSGAKLHGAIPLGQSYRGDPVGWNAGGAWGRGESSY